ncbi:MAG: hypothetical protein AAB432_00355 [Patescibacteria group bacterium]
MKTFWRIVKWPLVIIAVLFVALVIYRIPAAEERLKTEEAVNKIHAQKITLADVLGQNLPPEPDATLNNATVEGIDTNKNGIRDDVELAIFKMYPTSSRIRAAELQYALALQNELTQVFNSETFVGAVQEASRGFFCIGDTFPKLSSSTDEQTWQKQDTLFDTRIKEVETLVFNTPQRIQAREESFRNATTHGDINKFNCDIDLKSLPN